MGSFAPAIIGLLGVLVGAAISTATTYFLVKRKEESDERTWRRDRCLEAYSELVQVVELVRHECDICYLAKKCETEEHVDQARVVYIKMAEMNRLALRFTLLASRIVQAKMNNLTSHVGDEMVTKSITCPKMERSEVDAARTKLSELIADFIHEARNDLGIHPQR